VDPNKLVCYITLGRINLASDKHFASINEKVPKNYVYNSIFDFCWSTLFAIRLAGLMKEARLKGVDIQMQYCKHCFPLEKWKQLSIKWTKNKVSFFFPTPLLYLLWRWVNLHSSLLGQFKSYEENKVLRLWQHLLISKW
jgi:hypothetical protein